MHFNVIFREYAGRKIRLRPRYWKARFKGARIGQQNVVIYNVSFLGVWVLLSIEED